MKNEYLKNVIKQFHYYKMLADKTFEQISEQDFFWKYNEESNSIAVIIKHLAGNMISRFTDFLNSDGEKEWRNRDEEFSDKTMSREKIIELWESGWSCMFHALSDLEEEDLDKIIYIRNAGHTVMDAINRQLSHYPYHVGQIVFLGKMICNEKWVSLSIPKGKSEQYNQTLFSKEKRMEHFTDQFLKKE